MAAFEEQGHPEAVDGSQVGKPIGVGRQKQLGLVHLEAGHHRDVEAHVGTGSGPLLEYLGKTGCDVGSPGHVGVLGLGPDVDGERGVGSPHPHRRDGLFGRRGRGAQPEIQENSAEGARTFHFGLTVTQTGFVSARGVPSAAKMWALT